MPAESTVLILPGLGDSGPDHWQSHWEREDPTCRRVRQAEWDAPVRSDWVAGLDAAIDAVEWPVVLVGHSTGCALVAHWAASVTSRRYSLVRGALLVAPSDPDSSYYPPEPQGFSPLPLVRLPFPTVVVASTNDPYLSVARAREYAEAWGSRYIKLMDAGHINVAAGFGPWPEGRALLEELRRAPSTGTPLSP